MKAVLSIILAGILVSAAGYAQGPANTYIGLFLDSERQVWCAEGSIGYSTQVWFWFLPGENGLYSVSLNLSVPDDVVWVSDGVYSPHVYIPPTKCNPPCPYFRCFFEECHTGWVWAYYETLIVNTLDPARIELLSFPANDTNLTVYNCADEEEPAVRYSSVFLNYAPTSPECLGVAVEPSSWGAVKGLFHR